MQIPSPSNLRIFVPSISGDCVSVAPTANRRREAPSHASSHGAGIAGRVACARCHRAATLRHRVAELRHHCSRAATQRGSNSGDLDEEKAGENVERDDQDTGAPDVVKIAIECRSEEHTYKLQSQMRI